MNSIDAIKKLAQKLENKYLRKDQSNYGGKGKFSLPTTHIAGMKVPYGGSCCANCKFLEMKDDGPHCKNSYWVEWNGGESRLPVDDPKEYCSDWYEPQ